MTQLSSHARLTRRALSVSATLALAGLVPSAARAANIALGRAVVPSDPTWAGLNGYLITDGDPNTISHPLTPTTGSSFVVDLGQNASVSQIDVVNRNNCCPERLSNYRVSLLSRDPAGGPGAAVFSSDVRTDGTNSGLGGVDTVPVPNATGRFVRVERIDNGAADYQPQIAELIVEGVAPLENVALNKPVVATGNTWPGFPAGNVNDGLAGTITHPQAGDAGPFQFDIDLGDNYALDHINVYNRGDGCCPERLGNYTVSLLSDDGGAPGAVLWSALVRDDGTNSGNGGLDELLASDGTGTFAGRWLRIASEGVQYGPQLAEIEAFAVPEPGAAMALLGAAGCAVMRRRRRDAVPIAVN